MLVVWCWSFSFPCCFLLCCRTGLFILADSGFIYVDDADVLSVGFQCMWQNTEGMIRPAVLFGWCDWRVPNTKEMFIWFDMYCRFCWKSYFSSRVNRFISQTMRLKMSCFNRLNKNITQYMFSRVALILKKMLQTFFNAKLIIN